MTINLYPQIVHDNNLSPDEGFGSEIDTSIEEIQAACKGWGANASKVIEELGNTDAETRTKLAARYKELSEGQTLTKLMKKEFRGDFGTALEFLALPPHEAECAMLKKATDGIGASVNIVYSILCGRTNAEMEILKKTYFRLYTKDLGKLMASELHGDMERLVFNCLQASEEEYDPQYHTMEKATDDAEVIYKKGQGRWGTEERGIFKILCASPKEHLQNVNQIYADRYGYSLEKALEKELGGNVEKAALFTVGMKLKPFETIAKLIKTACAGFGTDELLLTCCCIRYQYVMNHVMPAHIELFGKTVQDRIRHETSGNYKKILLEITNRAWPEG